MSSKICKVCQTDLPLSDYYSSGTTIGGKKAYKNTCKKCYNIIYSKGTTISNSIRNDNLVDISQPEKLITNPQFMNTIKSLNDIDLYQDYPEFIPEQQFIKGKHKAILIAAPREKGKTTLLLNWLHNIHKLFDFILFFSESKHAPIYQNFLQETDEEFNSKIILRERYNQDLMKYIEKFQKQSQNALNILCIQDDDCNSNKKKYNHHIEELFNRGRNINITNIFSAQNIMYLLSYSRDNTDYVVILQPKGRRSKLNIVDNYLADLIPVPEEYSKNKAQITSYLIKWLMDNTKDHRALVLDLSNEEVYSYQSKNFFGIEPLNKIKE